MFAVEIVDGVIGQVGEPQVDDVAELLVLVDTEKPVGDVAPIAVLALERRLAGGVGLEAAVGVRPLGGVLVESPLRRRIRKSVWVTLSGRSPI